LCIDLLAIDIGCDGWLSTIGHWLLNLRTNNGRQETMPGYQKFEELPVWQEAARLYNRVLDLLEEPHVPLTPGFRNQLDRAALSVSNNIAEGFERVTTNELKMFLAIARGSAGEVRSMMAVVKDRPKLKPITRRLQEIRSLAESCARQLTGWTASLDLSPVQGKRHLTADVKEKREAIAKVRDFRLNFLRNLLPAHPLYNSPDARAARGEGEK
jgi:four helix bundle protein